MRVWLGRTSGQPSRVRKLGKEIWVWVRELGEDGLQVLSWVKQVGPKIGLGN